MGHAGVGWGGSCKGGLAWGHAGVEWAVKTFTEFFICHKLGVLSFLLKNYCQLLSRFCGRRHILFVVTLVEIISVPLRRQATFLLFSLGINVIIMASRFFIQGTSGNNFLI